MLYRSLLAILGLGSCLHAQELASIPMSADDNHAAVTETPDQRDARMKWWRDAKFGMFIHYGLYSGLAGEWKGKPGGSEWIQKNVEVDTQTYRQEALPLFQPAKNAADSWIKLAKEIGCQYAVLTSKHHDGFALFDSKQTSYDTQDQIQRDIVKEFVTACRNHELKVGIYHSVIDWQHPDYDHTICPDLCYPKGQIAYLEKLNIPRNQQAYQGYLHAQVHEIMDQYGPIDIFWWDYSQGDMEGKKGWNAPQLIESIKAKNPEIIMNNRLYAYSGLNQSQAGTLDLRCGDYITPEKFIPDKGYNCDWEACLTVGDKWGYNRYDTKIKSSKELIGKLVECITKGGNLLLNINPKADGSVPEAVETSLRGLGEWVNKHQEAIYGTRAHLGLDHPASINDKGDIYLFIEKDSEIVLPPGKTKAYHLSDQQELSPQENKVRISCTQYPYVVIKLS